MAIRPKILVIGDSHASFWGGKDDVDTRSFIEGVDVLYVGPATAHNIAETISTSGARAQILDRLDAEAGRYEALVFSFGEIDCRSHILYAAVRHGITVPQAIENTVRRYSDFVIGIARRYNLPCVFWAPFATAASDTKFDEENPTVGTDRERNTITHLFNQALKAIAARTEGLGFVTMFYDMVDVTLSTRPGFFYDGRHLKRDFLTRAFELMKSEFSRLGSHRAVAALELPWPATVDLVTRNVVEGLKYQVSSEWNGNYPVPFDAAPRHDYYFHTEREPTPYILFDLGLAFMISHVRVINRPVCRERARTLRAAVSLDGREYRELERIHQAGSADDVDFRFASDHRLVRFVKLYLTETEHFHLRHVEVMAYVFGDFAGDESRLETSPA